MPGGVEKETTSRGTQKERAPGVSSASIPARRNSPQTRPICIRPITATSDESAPTARHGKRSFILGGGPNRIGQGIEFDYCCVHAAYALREAGFETIMVNCNPETVSTDYDTSDRLYFEPLTNEDVSELLHAEMKNGTLVGVIVQLGGQTPLKLAHHLESQGIKFLGTSPDAIDLAEDRERFQQLLHKLNILQPPNGLARSKEEALAVDRKRSASRSSSVRPTCWAGAAWKSCTTSRGSNGISARR